MEAKMHSSKVICFDLWGTLAFSPGEIVGQYHEVLQRFSGSKISKAEVLKFVERELMIRKLGLFEGVKQLCQRFDIASDEAQVFICEIWQKAMCGYELYADSVECLKRLKDLGCVLVMITNSTSWGWLSFTERFPGFTDLFDLILASCLTSRSKPDSRLLQSVEYQYPGAEYWMIGDSFANDINPANRRGWNTVWLQRDVSVIGYGSLPFVSPNSVQRIIQDLSELAKGLV